MLAKQVALKSDAQNWQAHLRLALQNHADITRLVPKKRYGPLTVQRPFYPEKSTCHVYLLHPPGGIVGGDELELIIQAEENSQALITTPGATKFYRSAGKTAHIKQTLEVADNAQLEFFPLENIYFPGAKVHSESNIYLKENSQTYFWETHCFGRPANNELFDSGEVTLKLNIYNQLGLLLTEKQLINPVELQRSCAARGYSVLSNMVLATDGLSEELIEQCRAIECQSGVSGITRLDERLLVIRVLSHRTLDTFNYFKKIWSITRPQTLRKKACQPRIWQT